ncbi:MAG: hypothetical protein ACKPKO_43615, partial [Candidatus Fonsibacter sp.]
QQEIQPVLRLLPQATETKHAIKAVKHPSIIKKVSYISLYCVLSLQFLEEVAVAQVVSLVEEHIE